MSISPFSSAASLTRRCVGLLLLLLNKNDHKVLACTNLLVTPGASSDGKARIAYNADDGTMLGFVYHYPATFGNDPKRKDRKVYSWDDGNFLGTIPEAESTFNVVGNANAAGLVIAETSFGGILALADQPDAILDYGSLIYITLQRARTAREAIKLMAKLMDEYGYQSGGESFSLTDSTTGEVWVMEVIGRGSEGGKLGAAWVAIRIPDGAVSAHANQARITTFPRNDPVNCLYSDDVVDLAVKYGLYERSAGDPHDLKFSFSDTYDPVTYDGARFCEARVWAMFSRIEKMRTGTNDFQKKYLDYVTGKNYKNRMPLYITVVETKDTRTKETQNGLVELPFSSRHRHHVHSQTRSRHTLRSSNHRLSLMDVDKIMSDHYEDSPLSSKHDAASGLEERPYRPSPMGFDYNGSEYAIGERSLATQQTGWNFIAEVTVDKRGTKKCTALLWFGLDDSSTAPRAPVYGCSTEVSKHFAGKGPQDGVPSPVFDFNLDHSFWVQNMVSQFVYANWKRAYPVLRERRSESLTDHVRRVEALERRGLTVRAATDFTVKAGNELHKAWWAFYGELFTRFRDFYDFLENEGEKRCGCRYQRFNLDNVWKQRIVKDKGDFCKLNESDYSEGSMSMDEEMEKDDYDDALKPMRKLDLRALQ